MDLRKSESGNRDQNLKLNNEAAPSRGWKANEAVRKAGPALGGDMDGTQHGQKVYQRDGSGMVCDATRRRQWERVRTVCTKLTS